MSTSTIDTIGIFKGIATAHNSGLTALEVIKGHIETLRKEKIVMGKSVKTCQYRVQCTDAYVSAFPKTAKKTIANYVTAVVDAVNNGAEFSFSASKGAAAPSKGKGKGKTKGKAEFSALLVKPFNHDGGKTFKDLCAKVEKGFQADTHKTIYAAFVDYLKSEGFEIAE
jgi:hypothetical protein